jgi:iron complex outermembrane receptor protein
MSSRTALRLASRIGVIAIVGASLPAETRAQAVASDQPIEKVEVTGSHIKRAEAETAENIQIITSEDIQRGGQPTVADYLRNISANFAAFNETFVNSFAAGAAGLALRGLSQKNTLVLLNGRRIANYGFAQNLEDTFVDLNVIPISAVERIEVLKSGANAIYGSDATAGVVNIILKQNSTDRLVGGGGSLTEEGGGATRDAWLSMGFGNFASDGYNVFATGSVFKRSDITADERHYTTAQDFRNINPPDGFLAYVASGTYISNSNPTAPTAAFPTCGTPAVPGRVIPSSAFPGIATGTTCAYNPAKQLSLDPYTERANLTSTFNLKLPAGWTAFGDAFYSDDKTTARFTPAQINSNAIAFNPATGGARVIPNTLPAGNPSNPHLPPPLSNADGSQDFVYTFNLVGGRDYAVWSNTYRVSGGVKGSWLNWDWEAAYGHSQNDVDQGQFNSVNVNSLASAIQSGSYNFLNPTPASVAGLRVDWAQESISKLDTVGLKGTGALFDLPAGPLSAAAGAEFRHESMKNQPDSQLASGQILGFGINKVDGGRSVYAGYAEVDVPILKGLETDLAAREEHYGDVGGNFSPRAELRWQPSSSVNFRATGSKGFRAPSLPEISNASSLSFQTVVDPLDPLMRPNGYPIGVVTQANPKLKPETSKNLDVGIVLSPTSNFNVSLDYYRISIDHVIATSNTAQNVVFANAATGVFANQIFRTPAGFIADVSVPYANVYQLVTSGYDFEGHATFPLQDAAKFRLDLIGTYISQMAVFNGSSWTDYAGSNGWLYASPISGGGPMPHLKGSLSGTWENPSWVGQATVRYIGTYHNYCEEFGICSNPASFTTGSNTTLDLYGEYRGLKNWSFRFSVVNLFNVAPPFDDAALFFSGYETYDQTLYDPRGRIIDLHVQYRF